MNDNKVIEILENNDFNVHEHDTDYELETWTSQGVNMIFTAEKGNLAENFNNIVNGFDIDEVITVNRYNEQYCNDFTYERSVNDFKEFKELLEEINNQIQGINN